MSKIILAEEIEILEPEQLKCIIDGIEDTCILVLLVPNKDNVLEITETLDYRLLDLSELDVIDDIYEVWVDVLETAPENSLIGIVEEETIVDKAIALSELLDY